MGRYIHSLSADETVGSPTLLEVQQLVDQRTADIIHRMEVEKTARKIGTLVTIAGALFAFIRLGIVTIPHLRRRRAMGSIGEATPVANPRRRRRRR